MHEPSFFHVIHYSFHTFNSNYLELRETIRQLLILAASDEVLYSSEKYIQISLWGNQEIPRRLHNYLASWFSLKDHAYRILKKIETSESKQARAFAEDYKNQVFLYFKDNIENKFIQDLRNHAQHNQLPIPNLVFRMSINEDGAANLSYSFEFSSEELLQKGDWSSSSKMFLQSQKQSFALDNLIEGHFNLTKDFYLWVKFREAQLDPYSPQEFKNATFEEWKKIVGV